MNEPGKKKRRSLKPSIGLKWALLLMLFVSLPLAWIGNEVKQARFEASRIEEFNELREYGLRIYASYDYELNRDTSAKGNSPEARGPKWLRKLFGEQTFSRIERIDRQGNIYEWDDDIR